MIRDVYLSRIEKIRGIRPKYRIPVFFSAPAIAKHIPSPLPVYKANLHPKLLPEPSFHPRQIFSFFFLPLVKFSKSDAGGIKERAFSRRFDGGDVFEIEDRDRISMVEARSNYTNRRDAPR